MPLPLEVVKERIKDIPFRGGKSVKIQTGRLVDAQTSNRFRYTRSLDFVRARYRITLQYSEDPQYVPYVFDVIRPAKKSELEVRPESEAAREIWLSSTDSKKAELLEALEAIFVQDIEPSEP